MEFQKVIFLKRWAKSIERSKTIVYDELKNYDDEFIIPFRNKKHTIEERILSTRIYRWCIDNGIECHQVDYESDYDDNKYYDALQIKFNF
jgi:hypothetical protein